MAVAILSIPQLQLISLADTLQWIFLVLLPNFSFGQALSDIYSNHLYIGLCANDFAVTLCQDFRIQSPCCNCKSVVPGVCSGWCCGS